MVDVLGLGLQNPVNGTTLSSGIDWGSYLNSGANALGAVGNYLGGKTNTTPSLSTGGFKSTPQEVQDFLLKTLFPDIQKAYSQKRPTGMKRQYTAEEANDPNFGSQARYYMQQQANNVPKPMQVSQPEAEQNPATSNDAMYARQMLMQMGGSMPSMYQTKTTQPYATFLNQADDRQLGDLGKKLKDSPNKKTSFADLLIQSLNQRA